MRMKTVKKEMKKEVERRRKSTGNTEGKREIKRQRIILVAGAGIVLLAAVCYFALPLLFPPSLESSGAMVAGGNLHFAPCVSRISVSGTAATPGDTTYSERFQRPSKALPYPNPYSFRDFQNPHEASPPSIQPFDSPEDLLLAYYGILRDASNMLGYSGGCGTIGMSKLPYPYAYELLAKEKQAAVSPDQFVDSFEGVGYTTLLKLLPAYAPPETPAGTKYYMVETEVITGVEADSEEEYGQGSRFAYYYGLIATEETQEGWKIKDICYIPEDFLCAPMHGWFYLADAVVQIVYCGNLKLIDRIDKIEHRDSLISVYASGEAKNYRFDFVRLTNGYNILLHEYILENGAWVEASLLPDDWQYLKFSAEKERCSISHLSTTVGGLYP